MKSFKNLKFGLAVFLIALMGCSEGDTVFDSIVDQEQRGAVIRTVELFSNELPIGVAGAGFSGLFEVQTDDNDAADFVEVYVGYRDQNIGEGEADNSVAQSLYETIDATTFEIGEFGYPRFDYAVSLTDMLTFTGITEESILGGDQFEVRFELVLSDGRRFSFDDNTGTLTGSFFSSPFLYTPTVICPIPEGAFTGTYNLTQTSGGIFGTVFADGPVEVVAVTGTQRTIQVTAYPQFGGFARQFNVDLVCNNVVVFSTDTALSCGGPNIIWGPTSETTTYDANDDSTISFIFLEDGGGCGGSAVVSFTLTKQ